VSDDFALQTIFVGEQPARRRLRRARLVVVDGPDRGKELVVDRERVTIGRSVICNLVLTDHAVSGSHCEVRAHERGFLLRDLDSTNGTSIGGLRIREVWLSKRARASVRRPSRLLVRRTSPASNEADSRNTRRVASDTSEVAPPITPASATAFSPSAITRSVSTSRRSSSSSVKSRSPSAARRTTIRSPARASRSNGCVGCPSSSMT
jgi:hypothetical protein